MTLTKDELFYKNGYEIAIENARRLYFIAEKSAQENIFSIASSLSILAAEEALKASFLLVRHFAPEEKPDDFDKIFRDHKTKHRYLPETSDLFEIIVELLYTEHGIFKYLFDQIDKYIGKFPDSQKEPLLKARKILLNFLEKTQFQNKEKVNIEEAKKWWKKADLLKIRGFYVDQLNDTWHNPGTFTKIQYDEVQNYTRPIIENADKIKELIEKSMLDKAK